MTTLNFMFLNFISVKYYNVSIVDVKTNPEQQQNVTNSIFIVCNIIGGGGRNPRTNRDLTYGLYNPLIHV